MGTKLTKEQEQEQMFTDLMTLFEKDPESETLIAIRKILEVAVSDSLKGSTSNDQT